jgi:PUA domain protein
MTIKKRHRLRSKEAKSIIQSLQDRLGVNLSIFDNIETGEVEDITVLIHQNEIFGIILNDQPFLTLRGLMAHVPTKRFVTVDMGAVRFVVNGADIMAPGIVEVDTEIEEGDLVWIRDVNNNKPLAVGIALTAGMDIMGMGKGKAVKNIHWVGDTLWTELE